MKTALRILIIAIFLSVGYLQAQNLMVNGDLETWTAGVPDGWTLTDNITQETTTIHGGSSSARQESAGTSQKFQQVVPVQEGQEYTISYWYYDNDPDAKTRIWSYWLSGGTTLPDNGDVLRPSTYSTDSPAWVEFTVTLTAPATADEFRFEVRGYQEASTGGSVYYDDFSVSGDITVDPEPTNYPTAFTATANGLSVDLAWVDATGTQLPSSYIIMAGTSATLPVPVDGTPVLDDMDLSDGSGAINIDYGMQSTAFSSLDGNTTYYFTIYPYTNGGANIDFKTDGTAPAANATTLDFTVIEAETFDVSWGNWTTVSVIGDQVWDRDNTYGVSNTPCAQMSGYSGGYVANEDWLISPALDLDSYQNEVLTFYNAWNYTGPDLELLVSENYSGSGDPNAATWIPQTFTLSPGSWNWTLSGDIDLSTFVGSAVYVAFKYTSSDAAAKTWEIDEITIVGEGSGVIDPEPTNYPTAFTATPASTSINLMWTDATGAQLPDGYIVFASTSATLPVPVDGTPVPNDPDLSDGNGAVNVSYGVQSTSFANLSTTTTYYFTIYSYTNSGSDIDYKNNGTAPTANATTVNTPEPTNYPTAFAASPASSSIDLTWMDATGDQLPEGYIVYASTSSTLPVPVDGTPVADDPDLSDGSGAMNVGYGVQALTFSNLETGTTYYFSIYSYTNSGTDIDYKNDGTAPTVNATTTAITFDTIESENFDDSWGNWTPISVGGDQLWDRDNTYGINSTPCARISGYSGGAMDNEDWLISPAMNFDNYQNEELVFYNADNYAGPALECLISTDYDGSGDPNSATWESLSFNTSSVGWEWTESGIIDVSSYNGMVYIAFKYTSNTSEAATWEVDDIMITGELEIGVTENQAKTRVAVYPNPATQFVDVVQTGNEYSVVKIQAITGSVVKEQNLTGLSTRVDVSELKPGIYFMSMTDASNSITEVKKLIIR